DFTTFLPRDSLRFKTSDSGRCEAVSSGARQSFAPLVVPSRLPAQSPVRWRTFAAFVCHLTHSDAMTSDPENPHETVERKTLHRTLGHRVYRQLNRSPFTLTATPNGRRRTRAAPDRRVADT